MPEPKESPHSLEHRFDYHPPVNEQIVMAHTKVRVACLDAAHKLDELVPDGREKSLAFTKLEEAMMWANAGIARWQETGR